MDDATLRAFLDDDGLLRPDAALAPPAPDAAYLVFAQRPDAALDWAVLGHHAERFFGAALAPGAPKRYRFGGPKVDAALVHVTPASVPGGARLAWGRPTSDADLDRAHRAEMRVGYTGMFDLAQRCEAVWLIAVDAEPDATALLVAAIFASVVLGPIVPPDGGALFGVRGARERLERIAPGYR